MSEQSMLDTTLERLFTDLMTTRPSDPGSPQAVKKLWVGVAEQGIPQLLLPETAGGFDGGWADAGVVFRRLGLHAIPAPVGEGILAHHWLYRAGVDIPEGPISIGYCTDPSFGSDACFSGHISAVPWGSEAAWLLVACGASGWVLLPTAATASVKIATNTANEPRSSLHFHEARTIAAWDASDAMQAMISAGALLRTGQMAGALETTLRLAVEHVQERHQFGRALGKFQALQQALAVLAEEAAAVGCAVQSACQAADRGPAAFEIAAAKLRANRAAAQATAIAHQVHGAIGFTREHSLHQFTLRLLAWRAEFGNDRYWAERLGQMVVAPGAGSLWQQLTSRGSPMSKAPETLS